MSSEKANTRWYIVSDKKDGAACLVEASNRAQAFRRTGEHYCTARPASVDEALRMSREGRDVIFAPNEPEQLDLEDSVVTGAETPAPEKEGKVPYASGPSDVSGPLSDPYLDGIMGKEPELPKVTDVVPEARKNFNTHLNTDGSLAIPGAVHTAKVPPPKPRKASDVFGPGFGPKSASDSID